MSKSTSLNRDANLVCSDTLRLMVSPVKWWKKISCFIKGVCTTGWCISRFLSEKIFSTWTWRISNKTRRQILQKHLAPKKKFGKEMVHLEVLPENVRLMSVVLAREIRGKITWGGGAPRKMRPQSSIRFGEYHLQAQEFRQSLGFFQWSRCNAGTDEQKKNRAHVNWILSRSPEHPLSYWLPTERCTPTRMHKCSLTSKICSWQSNS